MTDTIMLAAVQTQYKQAEQELRAAAEALKQLESSSRQLATTRDGLSLLMTEVSSGASALLGASTTFAEGVATIGRATEALQQADPVRLAKLTETLLLQVQARIDDLAASTRAMEVRAENTQGRLLVAMGETSAQVRSEVTTALGATQASIERTIADLRKPMNEIERRIGEIGSRLDGLQAGFRAELETAREGHRSDIARVTAAVGDAEKAAMARHAAMLSEGRIGIVLTIASIAVATWILRG